MKAFREEMLLLLNAGLVEENCHQVTEVSHHKDDKSCFLMNRGQNWSLRRDLDPRPLPYQGNGPT